MGAPAAVEDLVDRFATNRDAYTSGGYNEAQVRREFVDPLFSALGWDVQNERGAPEPYKDIIHEASLKDAGAPKAPDYSFRLGGRRKFFVETKRPSKNLAEDISPAYQLRRYGWSAKLPVSILTDFEEFAIYDTRVRPEEDDSPRTARITYLTFEEYLNRWDDLAGIFSKSAVQEGAFDEYAIETDRRRGQSPVDEEFLEEIESWREALASDIAGNNTALNERQVNTAVQRIIDRIVFLRICEDRGIEDYGQLQEATEKDSVYGSLLTRFREADGRYNSGLFHFESEPGRPGSRDTLTPQLSVDDSILTGIVENLYYPASPYEFSVLSPDILGQVYEKFLGRIIKLENGSARVVDKPVVRKSAGVYYTPEHIVSDIVESTLGEKLEGLRPDDVDKIRILDPACGSGSFLLGAYDKLLRWHLNWYVKKGLQYKKYKDRVYEAPNGEYRLTTREKKRILLNNIYGVDIDEKAGEVTKLSLLLKLLEDETDETLEQQLKLFSERALPDLASNIKCGNSLVGSDFYDYEQGALFDAETRYTVNPFDWDNQFPRIVLEEGGFDVVIGNPPYVFGEYLNDDTKMYFERNYKLAQDQYDTYKLFIERSLDLKSGDGVFSMIVPDPLLARDQAARARDLLLREGLDRVYHCGQVFPVNVSAAVVRVCGSKSSEVIHSDVRKTHRAVREHDCSRERFVRDERKRLMVHASDRESKLLQKLTEIRQLSSPLSISRGEEVGKKDTEASSGKKVLIGDDINPFRVKYNGRLIEEVNKSPDYYKAPKIVVVKTGRYPVAALDEEGYCTIQSVYNLHRRPSAENLKLRYVLGILNSRLARFYIYKTFTAYKLLYPQLNQSTVNSIPIPSVEQSREEQVERVVTGLEQLLRQRNEASTGSSTDRLQRQIDTAFQKVDEAVYDAFGLTDNQRGIIDEWEVV